MTRDPLPYLLATIGLIVGMLVGTPPVSSSDQKMIAAEHMMGWATQRAVKAAGDAGYQQGLQECAALHTPETNDELAEVASALHTIIDGCAWMPGSMRLSVTPVAARAARPTE